MKIAYVLPFKINTYGYEEQEFLETHFSIQIAQKMKQRGLEVEIHIFSNEKKVVFFKGIEVYFHKVSFKIFLNYDFFDFSLSFLFHRFDSKTIIHFHEPLRLFFLFFKLFNLKRIIILEHHGNGVFNLDFGQGYILSFFYSLYKSLFLKRIINNSNFLIVKTDYAKLKMIEFGINPSMIRVIGNAVSLSTNVNLKKNRIQRVDKKHIIFGFAGRVNRLKGIEQLIKAFDLLSQTNSNVELRIAGPLENDSYYDLVKPYWVGFLDKKNLISFYKNIDVFIFPTWSESFGISLLEAASYYLPIISSKEIHINELLKSDQVEWLNEITYLDILKKMKRCLSADVRLKMINADNFWISEKYSSKIIMDQYLNLYIIGD